MIHEPILVVDDEPALRDSLVEALRGRGYSVEAAASGEEALAKMAGAAFPVVVTDLRMPGGITGLDLLAAIRQRHPGTLCIVITAFATLDTSLLALKQGAYDLIQKPFHLAEIEVVLDRALDHARVLRQVAAYREELETRILARTRDLGQTRQEALALCDLTLQALEAPTLEAALAPLLDRLAAQWAPAGLACYRRPEEGPLICVLQRGPRTLPDHLERPFPGPLPAPGLGYPEERLVPLGLAGWIYLGFQERSAFSEADPAFLLLARHLELALRSR